MYDTLRLIMMIGIPGSGKSTYVKSIPKEGVAVICPDEIREELTGDASDQTRNSEVFDLAYKRMRFSLYLQGSVVFDATSLTKEARKKVLSYIPDRKNTTVEYVWMDTPLEECLKRNASRERSVPEPVIRRMAEKLEPPTPEECDIYKAIRP